MSEVYIFKPRLRVLIDLLLCWAVALLLISTAHLISAYLLLAIGLGWAVLFSLIWFFWVGPVFKIIIKEGKIFGPSPSWKRISFPVRKLDHHKLLHRTKKQKFFRYRDLCSLDGPVIRVWYKVIGKIAAYEIMEIVEKYPFREAAKENPESGPEKS